MPAHPEPGSFAYASERKLHDSDSNGPMALDALRRSLMVTYLGYGTSRKLR